MSGSILSCNHWHAVARLTCLQCMGVCVRVLDVTLAARDISIGAGQIIPTTRRMVHAAMYTAGATLLEPMYRVEVSCCRAHVAPITELLAGKGAEFVEPCGLAGAGVCVEWSPVAHIHALVRVSQCEGLVAEVHALSEGAVVTLLPHHWEAMPGDVFEAGSPLNALALSIRARKGEPPVIPPLSQFLDRL